MKGLPVVLSWELANAAIKRVLWQPQPSKIGTFQNHMGGCQNYGPSLGTLNVRCRTRIGTQKGTIILTTAHMIVIGPTSGAWGDQNPLRMQKLPGPRSSTPVFLVPDPHHLIETPPPAVPAYTTRNMLGGSPTP